MIERDARSTHMSGAIVHTIPLLRLLPGRPNSSFSCLTSFLGGIFLLLLLAYGRKRVVRLAT